MSLITLAVADVQRARVFYQRLGLEGQEGEETSITIPDFSKM